MNPVAKNLLFSMLCFTVPVAERPQHMLMRVSVGIHGEDLPAVIEVSMEVTDWNCCLNIKGLV